MKKLYLIFLFLSLGLSMISCSQSENYSEDFYDDNDENGFVGYWRDENKKGYITEVYYFILDANGRGDFGGFDGYWSYNNSILIIDGNKEYHKLAITSKTDRIWTADDVYGRAWWIERMTNQDFCSFISRYRYDYIINEDDGFNKKTIFEKELERNGIYEKDIIVAKKPDDIFNPNKPLIYLSPTDHKTEAGTITIKNPYDIYKFRITFTGIITGTYYRDYRR